MQHFVSNKRNGFLLTFSLLLLLVMSSGFLFGVARGHEEVKIADYMKAGA